MYVDNEITDLQKVIVHFPDEGISRISPRRAETLLFDDIVFYPLMSKEYSIFKQVLVAFLGADNVLETEDLIEEAIKNCGDVETLLIDRVIDFEELPLSFKPAMVAMNPEELSQLLITGYHAPTDHMYFDPIPNFMFTRDIAVTIKDHVLITKASKEARFRENLLSQFIFAHHPSFQSLKDQDRIIDLNDRELFPPSRRAETVCAEGGDIMMFGPDHLLIGTSERSTAYAFHSIKDKIFEKGLVKNVVQVNIPNERSFMHIDTLFSRIDYDLISCHKPIVYDGEGSNVIVHSADGTQSVYASIKDFVQAEISNRMQWVFSGGGISPYQEREQWTDSVNLVCVKPGVAISYDRNVRTLKAFEEAGYTIMSAEDVVAHASKDGDYTSKMTKTIITIPSAELSRARGGSHCMTCPVVRGAYQS